MTSTQFVLVLLVVVGVVFAMHAFTAWHLHRMQKDQHRLIVTMNGQLDDSRKMMAARDYPQFAVSKVKEKQAEGADVVLSEEEQEKIADSVLWRRAQNTPNSVLGGP